MNFGIIGKINKIVEDGNLSAPGVSNEFFFDPNSAFGKIIIIIEKMINKFIEWWNDGSRVVKRNMTEAKMKLGKMFGIEPIKMSAPAIVINLITDDGRISATAFKQNFSKLRNDYMNLLNVISTGYLDGSSVDHIRAKMSRAATDARWKLDRFKQEYNGLSEGPGEQLEIGGDDIRELDKIIDVLLRGDWSSSTDKIDFIGDFKKVYARVAKEEGEGEAVKLASEIADIQKEVILILEQASTLMLTAVGSISRLSEKISAGKASMEDFSLEEVEPLIIDTAPSNALFEQLGTISAEAMDMGNISRYFRRKADNLSVSVQEGFKYLTTYNYEPMETLHPAQLASYCDTLDFLDHGDLKVPQPNGFKGELLPLTAMYLSNAKIMRKILTEVIRPATSRFGHYLTVPFDRADRRDFEYGINIGEDREALVKAESQYYTSNRSSTTTLDKVCNSFTDLVTAERNMMEVNSILHAAGTEEVKKAVQALVQTAGALIRRISDEPKITTSNEFAKMVADQLSEVGRWVEWYAAQMTRIIETNNCLYTIEKDVMKL